MNIQKIRIWVKENKGIAIALFIASFYLITAFLFGRPYDWLVVFFFLLLPLACIFFSEEMGGYTGMGSGRAGITRTTPGCFVLIAGWALLLLPLFLVIFMMLFHKF